MIIGLSGFAGTGKDTVADILVKKHGFHKIGFADMLKHIAKEVYDFTDEQLYGPSEERNRLDKRYPREHTWGGSGNDTCQCCGIVRMRNETGTGWTTVPLPECYLTTRYALQLLGTEWGRHCYEHTWVDIAVRVGSSLLVSSNVKGVVFSDVRFKNEVFRLKDLGVHLERIKRQGYDKPAFDHPSETEQLEIPDNVFDGVLMNMGTLLDLEQSVDTMLARCRKASR